MQEFRFVFLFLFFSDKTRIVFKILISLFIAAANNGNTHNLQKLIAFVVQQLLILPIGTPISNSFQAHTQCANGLFLLRVSCDNLNLIEMIIFEIYKIFLKHLVDTSGEPVIQAVGLEDLWVLVKALIDFLIDHAVTENTCIILITTFIILP